LYNALQNPQCMVQVCKPLEVTTDENKIIFRTTVKQAEKELCSNLVYGKIN